VVDVLRSLHIALLEDIFVVCGVRLSHLGEMRGMESGTEIDRGSVSRRLKNREDGRPVRAVGGRRELLKVSVEASEGAAG
jgi:hypothetical protein